MRFWRGADDLSHIAKSFIDNITSEVVGCLVVRLNNSVL